jgi:hypothetical protein
MVRSVTRFHINSVNSPSTKKPYYLQFLGVCWRRQAVDYRAAIPAPTELDSSAFGSKNVLDLMAWRPNLRQRPVEYDRGKPVPLAGHVPQVFAEDVGNLLGCRMLRHAEADDAVDCHVYLDFGVGIFLFDTRQRPHAMMV